jgi:hypothetical protein
MSGEDIPDEIWSQHMAHGAFLATIILAALFLAAVVFFILLR